MPKIVGVFLTNEEAADVEYLRKLHVSIKVPNLCRCGANLDYHQCWCEPKPCSDARAIGEPVHVANDVCDLGEQCRCLAAYGESKSYCWNSKS